MNEQKYKEFQEAAKPLINFIARCRMHTKCLVDCSSAELVEGVAMARTELQEPESNKPG